MKEDTSKLSQLTQEEKLAIDEYLTKKGLPTWYGVTFRDVRGIPPPGYIPPPEELRAGMPDNKTSSIRRRAHITDFRSTLAGNMVINIPLTSSNMQAVTGADLAIALAREGGIGFLPQMIKLEDRLAMIDKIRRADSAFIDECDVLTVREETTLGEAKEVMRNPRNPGIWSVVVVDAHNIPKGIMTHRNWRYETDDTKPVSALMTKEKDLYVAKANISFDEARRMLRKYRIEKLPLVNGRGKLAGLLTAHGLFYETNYPRALRDGKGKFIAAATIGVGEKFDASRLREIEAQLKHGASVIMIDAARINAINGEEMITHTKKEFPEFPLIAGNTCSPEGTKFAIECGTDAVKVNIGRSLVCTTSRESAVGVAQLYAIAECSVIAHRHGKHIMADGGMTDSSSCIQSLAAGADTLMSGTLFIGTHESAEPADMVMAKLEGSDDKFLIPAKNYFGSASSHSQRQRIAEGTLDAMREPEGRQQYIPVHGSVANLIFRFLADLRSAMSFADARNLNEFRENAVFKLQSTAAHHEGKKMD